MRQRIKLELTEEWEKGRSEMLKDTEDEESCVMQHSEEHLVKENPSNLQANEAQEVFR